MPQQVNLLPILLLATAAATTLLRVSPRAVEAVPTGTSTPVPTTAPPPKTHIEFDVNVTRIEDGRAFSAICEIGDFTSTGRNFTVKFMRNRTELATFDVHATNPIPTFIAAASPDIVSASQFTFPIYEIRAKEMDVRPGDLYYCVLEAGQKNNLTQFESNKWSAASGASFNHSVSSILISMTFLLAAAIQL